MKCVGGLLVVAVMLGQWRRRADDSGDVTLHRPDLGRAFRLVVAAEIAVGAAGLACLRLVGAPWQANVAWIAAVVGAHFLALAVVRHDSGIPIVGTVMTTVGVTVLTLAGTGTVVAWIPAISGLASGFALLFGSPAASGLQARWSAGLGWRASIRARLGGVRPRWCPTPNVQLTKFQHMASRFRDSGS